MKVGGGKECDGICGEGFRKLSRMRWGRKRSGVTAQLGSALTDEENQHSSQDGASVFGALGAQVDAGHGHQEHHHRQESQDGASDHQGTSGLDVGCGDTRDVCVKGLRTFQNAQ